MNRLCVFCGENPVDKNKEHILAQWLLEFTGDPKRVVKMGFNYDSRAEIRFSWNSLVVPACETCNSHYGEMLESRVKSILENIVSRRTISAKDHIVLLDWLDKVRVGLWLNYMLLQKGPFQIEPNFRINNRISRKDRMMAIYTIDDKRAKGLNAIGVETPLFQLTPCCFGLRVNDILLFNMSSDYLFSAKCGFPAPAIKTMINHGPDTGKIMLDGFSTSRRTEQQLIKPRLIKPAIQLVQPIMQPDTTGIYPGKFLDAQWELDSFLAAHTMDLGSSQGILFRQYENRVRPIYNPDELVEFDEVSGNDSVPIGFIVAQVYEWQCKIFKSFMLSSLDKHTRTLMRLNFEFAKTYRKLARPQPQKTPKDSDGARKTRTARSSRRAFGGARSKRSSQTSKS
jgi:hypothetical protein